MKILKKLIKWILIAVVALFALVMGVGIWAVSSEDNAKKAKEFVAEDEAVEAEASVEEEKVEEPEPKPEEVEKSETEPVEEEPEEKAKREENHIYIGEGDAVGYDDGTLIVPLDAGITTDILGDPMLYLEVDIQNQNDSGTVKVYDDDFSLYIDNYQIQITRTTFDNEDYLTDVSYVTVNPHKKAKLFVKAKLPSDYDSSEKIEIGFPGTLWLMTIKENGFYTYGRLTAPSSAESDVIREYDDEGILGRYTQVGNPSILLFVEEYDGIIFTVDSGSDIISAGMGSDGTLSIGTDDDAPVVGSFVVNSDDTITLSGMENLSFNGTYQK